MFWMVAKVAKLIMKLVVPEISIGVFVGSAQNLIVAEHKVFAPLDIEVDYLMTYFTVKI